VNGKLTKTCTNKSSFIGTSTVNLGQWTSDRKWVGGIRDAKIYSRALSAAEIENAGDTGGLTFKQAAKATSFPKAIGTAPVLGFNAPAFTAMALVKRTGNGAGDYSIFGTDTGGTNKGLHLIVRNRKYYMGFYNNDCASPTGSALNKWEHVAFVYGDRAMKIYVNGKLTKTCTNKSSFIGTSTVNLGQWAKDRKWVGGIRDAKIYSRALSAAEIENAGDTGAWMFTLTTRGDTGSEQVKFVVGDEVKTVTLSTTNQDYTFVQPENGQFSVSFLNDNGPRNVRLTMSVATDVTFKHFAGWNCGSSNENIRCQYVRDGVLAWSGEYKYTITE